MAKTKIEDIIVPEIFTQYMIERTAKLSRFFASGIIAIDSELNTLASGGGQTINMPFWKDIGGDDEVLSDSTALTPDKITASKDIAIINNRGRAFSVNDLARILSGDDPLGTISNRFADYWVRQYQKMLISILTGVFSASSMSTNVLDISGTGSPIITANATIDAMQLMGENSDLLTAIAMHSAVRSKLLKDDLIEFIPDSEGKSRIATYLGKEVIVDDGLPFDSGTGVYSTYLFGRGAIAYGEGVLKTPVESDRDILAGDDVLTHRRRFIMHPRGVKFTSASLAGASPTNTEFEIGTNWEKVYETQNVRIVELKHKIA